MVVGDCYLECYCSCVSAAWSDGVRKELGVSSCGGLFSAALTCWLMILQRLEGLGVEGAWLKVSADQALRLSPGSKRARQGLLSCFAGGYSYARQALPLTLAERVAERLFWEIRGALPAQEAPAFLLDGSSLSPDGSASLREAFPPCRNQHGRSHFPVLRLVVAHDLDTGLGLGPCWGPMYGESAVSEQELGRQAILRLPPGCLVVADRNFGVFGIAYATLASGRNCLLRLTASRAGCLLGKQAALEQEGEHRLVWRPSKQDRKSDPGLPAHALVQGRLVVRRARQGERWVWLYLFVSDERLPAHALAPLYARRWCVETDLRSLKHSLKVARLSARSPQMLEKELVLAVAAYNLVRAVGAQAAGREHLEPRQLSFSRVCACVQAYAPRLEAETDPARRGKLLDELFERITARRLKKRDRPPPPRHVWERRSRYPSRKPQEAHG